MRNRIRTITRREIANTKKRFLSLLLMSFLGVGFFAGLGTTSTDMQRSLDRYYDEYQIYDIKMLSTLGFNEKTKTIIQAGDPNLLVDLGYSIDAIMTYKDNNYIVNTSSITTLNQFKLLEGKMPTNKQEILLEYTVNKLEDIQLGDEIYLDSEYLKEPKYKVVGFIKSPLYIGNNNSKNIGNTNLGDGKINYYAYLMADAYDLAYYTNLFITSPKAKEKVTGSKAYDQIIDSLTSDLEDPIDKIKEDRYQEIYQEAKDKIDAEKRDGEKALLKAKNTLNQSKKQLDNLKKNIDQGYATYYQTLKDYNLTESSLSQGIKALQEEITKLENILPNYPVTSGEYNTYYQTLTSLKETYHNLNKLVESKKQLDKLQTTYNSSLKKYQTGLSEYNQNTKSFSQKINEAYHQLDELAYPTIYLNTRIDNNKYSSFLDNTASIQNISRVFPAMFFVVAVLISLITMSRMIEDDRLLIGTLKSLGFNNWQIITKYLWYSSLATIIGGTLGMCIGFYLIPTIIWHIYQILFNITDLVLIFNTYYAVTGLTIALICIVGTSLYTALKVLREKPASLMRPKTPKNGKRVILEHWPWLWNRLSFSNKVTLRNLFRYKKRVIMTVLGIAGCTALILIGYGIRDGIQGIVTLQYNKISTYSTIVALNDEYGADDQTKILDHENVLVASLVRNETATIRKNKQEYDVSLVIPTDNTSFTQVINLINLQQEQVSLTDNDILLTKKLAQLLGVNKNDQVILRDNNHHEQSFKVKDILENYINHYVYMSASTFEKFNGHIAKPNSAYIKLKELSLQNSFQEDMLEEQFVSGVIAVSEIKDGAMDMLNSLDLVVIILIVSSASLAFVVLYNLSNINIQERTRELATLKVLGFYPKEIDSYVTKENIILTLLGIFLGLVLGTYLTHYIITTCEIETMSFIQNIEPISYLIACLLTIFFTLIVNIITHFTLDKIDMIESLKTIE